MRRILFILAAILIVAGCGAPPFATHNVSLRATLSGITVGAAPQKIWISGGWYNDGLPTNHACAPGVGGTATGQLCWWNSPFSGFATPVIPELSPFVVARNPTTGDYQYLFSSANSYFCSSPITLIQATVQSNPIRCTDQSHNWMVRTEDAEFSTLATIGTADGYRRNYQGSPSGVVISSAGQQYIFSADHSENKNEALSHASYLFQNSVTSNQPASVCSWPDGGATLLNNCITLAARDTCGQDLPWFATNTASALCNYFGFVNGANSPPLTAGNNYGEVAWNDLGPIIWPSAGYIDGSGNPASRGVRHPFVFDPGDGYLYIYYLDTTPSNWGIKVARSPKALLGAVGTWMNYDSGNGQWDLPSVPNGLTKANYTTFYATHGPAATNLWNDDGADAVPMTFQVARLTGLPGYSYIGVEEWVHVVTSTFLNPAPFTNWDLECAATRLSSDMIHWTPPRCIPTDVAPSYAGFYPVVLSADGSTDQVVNASRFYVVSNLNAGAIPYIQSVSLLGSGAGLHRVKGHRVNLRTFCRKHRKRRPCRMRRRRHLHRRTISNHFWAPSGSDSYWP